jgi:acyl carrier protein phosphodiesterase
MDILYDHFLANDPDLFTHESLFHFSNTVYTTLEGAAPHLPPVFAHMMVYMRSENWLWNYRTREGMQKSLKGLVRRAAYIHESEPAYRLFNEHYSLLQECYFAFIKDIENFAKSKFDEWIPLQP